MARTGIDGWKEHDACGVGFIAARDLQPTYHLTRLAVECLNRLDHRGAKTADGTGDGAGLMTQIPTRLIARELAARGKEVDPSRLGVVVCFLPPEDAATCRSLVAESLEAEDIELIMWRSVPCDPSVLGDYARDVLPIIEQAIVTAEVAGDELERALFLARKRMEREAPAGFAAPSASSRVVVYKGLFTASRIADFYWDLRDPGCLGRAAPRRVPLPPARALRLRQPRQRVRVADAERPVAPPRDGDAHPCGVGERRRPVAGARGLLRLSRLPHRALGRTGCHRRL